MLFVTFQYALFLLCVWVGIQLLARAGARGHPRAGNGLLLAASLLFYTLWIPAYLPLLLADIGVNYALLRGIAASERGSRRRRVLLALSIAFTLGLLLWFKYAAFAVESAVPLLRMLAVEMPVPEILLPLGISFYSFQIISLAVDTHRGEGPPVDRLSDYALYIAFFPQLVAGPILRGHDLLPQLASGARPTPERTRRGLWLLASGVVKKVIFADFLLAPFVDAVFDAPGVGNARFHWTALLAFSFQIYFDFSGYTDMARGSALLLGFEIPMNFREPYLSRDPAEFWRRWHMTLSTWLRDYLYIPLGGNRRGPARTRANLLVTMLLGGLWHGADWTFVLWGAVHGALLVLHRLLGRRRDPERVLAWRDLPLVAATFLAVSLAWVFFRSPDLASALRFFEGLFVPGTLPGWPLLALLAVVAAAGLHGIERALRPRSAALQAWFAASPPRAWLEAIVFGVLAGAAVLVAGAGGEFIYFQF
jgi:alginate O-acetyltransferase complex protein AlgI